MGQKTNRGRPKPVIGLIGAIGAGKSEVASIWGRLGGRIIDSDDQVRQELGHPDVGRTIRSWWGEAVVAADGGLDRRRIGEIVFGDAEQLRRLEALLYPRLARHREGVIQEAMADPTIRAVVLDSPKLIEAGLAPLCDFVVAVDAARALRLGRVASSRGWDDSELARRESHQLSLDKKREFADYLLVNNSSVDALQLSARRLFEEILDRVQSARS